MERAEAEKVKVRRSGGKEGRGQEVRFWSGFELGRDRREAGNNVGEEWAEGGGEGGRGEALE